MFAFATFLDVLVLVEGLQLEVVVEASEGVYQVGAQVWVDVARQVLGQTQPVHGPISVVTHHALSRLLTSSI